MSRQATRIITVKRIVLRNSDQRQEIFEKIFFLKKNKYFTGIRFSLHQLDVPVVALHDAVVVLALAYAQAVAVAEELARVLHDKTE